MICASIREKSTGATTAALRRARELGAGIAEVRLDNLPDPDLSAILANRPLPVIVTLRRDSGLPEGERLTILRKAAAAGADYVDVEHDAAREFLRYFTRETRTRLIVSFHDFDRAPSSVEGIARELERFSPDVVKIAVRPENLAQAIVLAELPRRRDRPTIALPIGEEWSFFRILYRRWGGFLTYCSMDAGAETAEGQVSLDDMRRLYRSGDIGPATTLYGLLGYPIDRSASPALFNRLFRERELDAVYLPLPLRQIDALRSLFDALPLRGGSVTIPHKISVMAHLDAFSGEARGIGAANTILNDGGRLLGHNTDAGGAIGPILAAVRKKHGSNLDGMRTLVIGYGGAARAIAWGLRREGAEVVMTGRNEATARRVAEEVGCRSVPADAAYGDYRLLVNATPVSDALPIPQLTITSRMVVFDAVYTVPETELLRRAKSAGAAVVPGIEMFLAQASAQAKLFTGIDLPPDDLRGFMP